jgi:small subunit ribosomal protein S4
MTKIVQAKYKASRRLNVSIWGDEKDAFLKKNYKPGQHGQQSRAAKSSDFGLHLRAKQRLKNHYGRINETQFKNTFKKAYKMRGNTAEQFVGLLESRLDAVVYRMNFASSIFGARQLVSHKHIRVNGKTVNIPSYILKEGDEIELKASSKEIPNIIESTTKLLRKIPPYISFEQSLFKGKFIKKPEISEVPYPFEVEVHLVVEFYSR